MVKVSPNQKRYQIIYDSLADEIISAKEIVSEKQDSTYKVPLDLIFAIFSADSLDDAKIIGKALARDHIRRYPNKGY